jgi:hypothetical protein
MTDDIQEAERAYYRRRLNRGPGFNRLRRVRYVCDVCQDRRYFLGWSFRKVMQMCKTCNRLAEAEHLEKLGYCVKFESRCAE